MLTTEAAPSPGDDPWLGCNPFDPAFRDDPYPSLARLRALDPVNEMPVGIWRLTRYADVNRLLHDVPAGQPTTHADPPREGRAPTPHPPSIRPPCPPQPHPPRPPDG